MHLSALQASQFKVNDVGLIHLPVINDIPKIYVSLLKYPTQLRKFASDLTIFMIRTSIIRRRTLHVSTTLCSSESRNICNLNGTSGLNYSSGQTQIHAEVAAQGEGFHDRSRRIRDREKGTRSVQRRREQRNGGL